MATGRTVAELADVSGGTLTPGDGGGSEITVLDVTHDSRQAAEATLFVAVRGSTVDGHTFVGRAVAAGSPAICVDHNVGAGVPEILVQDTRFALGTLAAAVHDEPSRAMQVVGVTGTNGKTTVSHYVESIAASAGRKTGLIGTIHTHIGGRLVRSVLTTPEASDLQRLLARMRDEGTEIVATEVSSHALALGRVVATRFAVGAFTNLSQDHLDFHGDMDSYLAAKRKLFEDHEIGTAVVNIDDQAGRSIADSYAGDLLRVGSTGEIRHDQVRPGDGGTTFTLTTPWGVSTVTAPVVGDFNVQNAVMAAACNLAAGLDFEEVVAGLGKLADVPGRFEVVSENHPFMVIVDYAHTPEGVTQAVGAARGLGGERVIAVVGAGGDRDRGKRPLMGGAVSRADLAVITSDNPRSEDPEKIAQEVASGLHPSTRSFVDLDRRLAIRRAIESANDGDIVLILGRGHEPSQEVAGERVPFDDREVAREALADRQRSTDSGLDSGSMGG